MLNDDLNRRPRVNRQDNLGGMMVAAIVAAVVLIGLFMWAPWSSNRTADSSRPQTTVGSSTNRPATPASPTAPAPAAPAAPSSNK